MDQIALRQEYQNDMRTMQQEYRQNMMKADLGEKVLLQTEYGQMMRDKMQEYRNKMRMYLEERDMLTGGQPRFVDPMGSGVVNEFSRTGQLDPMSRAAFDYFDNSGETYMGFSSDPLMLGNTSMFNDLGRIVESSPYGLLDDDGTFEFELKKYKEPREKTFFLVKQGPNKYLYISNNNNKKIQKFLDKVSGVSKKKNIVKQMIKNNYCGLSFVKIILNSLFKLRFP